MSTDRHPKWVPVEPGTVIPAGQPYRLEWNGPHTLPDELLASERVCHAHDMPVRDFGNGIQMLVDSSWRPPLELPTQPTWGIAVCVSDRTRSGLWSRGEITGRFERIGGGFWMSVLAEDVRDFIPLTPEQVARIEGQR